MTDQNPAVTPSVFSFRAYGTIEIFISPDGDIVINQEQRNEDDDQTVIILKNQISDVLAAISALASRQNS